MQGTLFEGEKLIDATEIWYLTPPSGIFGATWRKGRLVYTDKRLFWLHSFGKKQFEQPTEKIVKAALEKRTMGPLRKSEVVLVLIFEEDMERKEALFSTKIPVLRKWVELIENILSPSR